jgi:hypothetical protein
VDEAEVLRLSAEGIACEQTLSSVMVFVSLTRLRVRSIRYLPFFAIHTPRALRQVKKAPGFMSGVLLPDRSWTFWTMTAWDERENMRRYMTPGAHKSAMPQLIQWCDEASVAHWDQEELRQLYGVQSQDRCTISQFPITPPNDNNVLTPIRSSKPPDDSTRLLKRLIDVETIILVNF